jgi:gas vesicle protein
MATTIPPRSKQAPRVRDSARGGETGRDAQYDLLTAALIGAAIGATATLLLRRGPSGDRPGAPLARGARWAGAAALKHGAAGAGWAKSRGGELLERIPTDQIEHDVRESFSDARDRIDSFVQAEIKDLRTALRRQRKRLGV